MRIEYHTLGEHGTKIEVGLGNQTIRLKVEAVQENGPAVLRAESE